MDSKKSIFELLLLPVVVTIVGSISTYMITQQQLKSAELVSKTQLESTERTTRSDQQIKIIQIFSDKITSKDIREREIAVRILKALDTSLALKLISSIAETNSEDPSVKQVAQSLEEQLTDVDNSRSYFCVISSHATLEQAINRANTVKNDDLGYPIHVYLGRNNFYAICVGGSQSKTNAEKIKKILREKGLKDSPIIRYAPHWENANLLAK
jgi:hypothetical protein